MAVQLISSTREDGHDKSLSELVEEVSTLAPQILHIQHEYGHWGGKNPPTYWFPQFVKQLRRRLPQTKIIATAHTVLPADYRFALGKGAVQDSARRLANFALIPWLRRWWDTLTWGRIDLTIVHSQLQVKTLAQTCPQARAICIPHFVPPQLPVNPLPQHLEQIFDGPGPFLLVFGFITPSKGQDLAIQIMPQILEKFPKARLILAGAARTAADQQFEGACKAITARLSVEDRVHFTGFVDEKSIPALYEKATLVLASFRETTGSGSLATAFAYGAPVLASDLPLNRELFDRMNFPFQAFAKETVVRALTHEEERESLRKFAQAYSKKHSIDEIAHRHWAAY